MTTTKISRLPFIVALCVMALAVMLAQAKPAMAAGNSMREGFALTQDGVRLYYRVVGTGTRTLVAPYALYHGTALDRLADGQHRLVTFDPRGRGRSDLGGLERLTLDQLVDDLDTIRAAVGAERISLIGWSGGGMEVFAYALRYPERVERIVQLAPVAARFEPYSTMMMQDRDRRTDQAKLKQLEARYAAGEFANNPVELCRARAEITDPALFADPQNGPLIPDVCQFENEHVDRLGRYFGQLFKSISGYDYRASLSRVTAPRLVIHGLLDNTPLAGNQEWIGNGANARLLTIEKAGHWPHYEQPTTTLAAIKAFVTDGNEASQVFRRRCYLSHATISRVSLAASYRQCRE